MVDDSSTAVLEKRGYLYNILMLAERKWKLREVSIVLLISTNSKAIRTKTVILICLTMI